MKIYLDTSALNRIFDDQSRPRVYLEATAMLIAFVLIEVKNPVDYITTVFFVMPEDFNRASRKHILLDSRYKLAGMTTIMYRLL
ncbi:MAG: hypothetical protein ACK41Q_12830 [Candidatus Brocadia sp.]